MNNRYIIWEDKYKTGYKKIDDQHKELLEIANNLYDCLENKDSENDELRDAFKKALRNTVDYIDYHLHYEEKIMHAIKYNKILEHASYHREFTQKIYDYVKLYENGSTDSINSLLKYLKEWFLNHILKTDKEFVKEMIDILQKM
ncbi:bacteriohemerythrin [Brachyspira alvinipulli]|uniref:bacteriohemerythrin n=1 Tax=Brachyspira alvinipulli TaxID=84379 RepID=UPI0004882FA2|nr:hemerythrin family protein [Brachyspira alvinipulli]